MERREGKGKGKEAERWEMLGKERTGKGKGKEEGKGGNGMEAQKNRR